MHICRGQKILVPAAIACLSYLVSCSSGIDSPGLEIASNRAGARGQVKTVRLVLVGTMSGSGSWRGRPARRGIEIARHVLDEREGPRIRLRVLDDRGDDRRSTRLVRRAAGSRKTDAVVFAGPPRAVARAESSLARSGIPAFLCYGDLEGAGRLTRHVFQMGPTFAREARLLVRDALRPRRGARLGALTEDSVMGEVARAALRNELEARHARLVEARVFEPSGPQRMGRHLRKLRAAGVRRLFVEASPGELGNMSAAFDRMGWEPSVFGFDLTLSPPYRGPAPPQGAVAADWFTRSAGARDSDRFSRFRKASVTVTGGRPRRWEFRSYLATLLAVRADRAGRASRRLERMRSERVAGVEVTLSRTDHLVPNARDVRLWEMKDFR